MKNILVVFTGGTIGSAVHDAVIDVDPSAGYLLLDLFDKAAGNRLDVRFDTIRPLQILSENCTPKHWETLLGAVKDADPEKYDGVVVAHGTDTLSYTAALLGYAFADIGVPFVITGSGGPLGTENSNGLNNFISAVEFIAGESLPGVFAVYESDRRESEVFLATRLLEADLARDQFSSLGGVRFGVMRGGRFVPDGGPLNPTEDELREKRDGFDFKGLRFDREVLGITPYPGLNYEQFDLAKTRPRAVLHRLYHSSTACAGEGKYALPAFIRRCAENGIDVYLQSFKGGRDLYATSGQLLQAGAIPLPLMSFEAALVKLRLAVNQNTLPARGFMEKELFFEFLR